MDAWFFIFIIISLCIASFLKFIHHNKHLPPGPPSFPIIGNLMWLRKPISDLEFILRRLVPRYGPLITIKIANRSLIFVSSHSLAHQALVQNGVVFANRAGLPPIAKLINKPQKTISSSSYGLTWRLLRRNFTQQSRAGGYAASRRRVLSRLIHRLKETCRSESSVKLIDHFQHAMFCLLVAMCFGENIEDEQVREIEKVQRDLILGFNVIDVFNVWPRLGRIIFRKRWKKYVQLRENQTRVLSKIIRARIQTKNINGAVAYVDTLSDLHLPEENRKLEEDEIVSLCSEFLTGGVDTTATALQWIIANLVKNPQIQDKLHKEINSVVGEKQQVEEEDLQKMPYLKAVVLEGLRRHPPSHLVMPHTVSQDVDLNGYVIPKGTMVNFMVAEMAWDPKVWKDPMEFRPERFICSGGGEAAIDITGSREIKMMPFGAGRRACPAYALAMLHLEYFVANLIWKFEWSAIEGDEVDLTEKQELTIVMKHPLRARISTRI